MFLQNIVIISGLDYNIFAISRNSLYSPNKKKATAVVALWLIVYSSGIVKYLPSLSFVFHELFSPQSER